MPDYMTASRTKDHFQLQLLSGHSEIVSIAPRLKLDTQGRPTGDALIVVGVKKINPLRFGPGATTRPPAPGIPQRLPVITAEGIEDSTQFVDIVIEAEGEIALESLTAGGAATSFPQIDGRLAG